jgi:hypothetical protein
MARLLLKVLVRVGHGRMLFRACRAFAVELQRGNPAAVGAVAAVAGGIILYALYKFARRPLGGAAESADLDDAFGDDAGNVYRQAPGPESPP